MVDTPDDVDKTAFSRFRPREQYGMSHSNFQPERFWMNDTIGPLYNPHTGLYHLFCQYNPFGTEWGNMSWYAAVSSDLVTWKQIGDGIALRPDQPYDKLGIFTGCVIPNGPAGEADMMTILYTSVSTDQLHWQLPYQRGGETLSIAVSRDQGLTWQKLPNNPIVGGPPAGLQVTGWRDPYISDMPSIDRLLGRRPGEYCYGTKSGGLADTTPTAFLYSVPRKDLTSWENLGPIVDVGLDFTPDARWSGLFGRNFECCSLFEFGDSAMLITSTEGHHRRCSIWIAGELRMEGSHLRFVCKESGKLDWGNFYAASTCEQPLDKRRLLMGWVTEDDLNKEQRAEQGWSGMATLPRELCSLVYKHVIGTLRSPVDSIGCFRTIPSQDGTYTVYTTGSRPAAELQKLRLGEPQKFRLAEDGLRIPLRSSTWELKMSVDLGEACENVNVKIQHSDTEQTTITFDSAKEEIQVIRTHSTSMPGPPKTAESGPHTLLRFKDAASGEESQEPLNLRIFFDVSVLEIYANDRFALTTRLYPVGQGSASLYISSTVSSKTTANGAGTAFSSSDCKLWQR